jgi:hypothetical protein
MTTKPTGLELLRQPFATNQISKLPKPTKQQTEAVKNDFKQGFRCPDCGGWHHPEVVHLDYVGHAALTDRLLEADINWTWEPVAFTELGLPAFDQTGGLWIRLTVCGITRLGYGHAAAKPNQDPGSREKEVIGDALRNAGMRFGAALDLWHKGDLHVEADSDDAPKAEAKKPIAGINEPASAVDVQRITELAEAAGVELSVIAESYLKKDIAELDANQAQAAIKRLKKTIDDKGQK